MESVRRRRIGRGEPHAEVERLLLDAQTLTPLAALVLFDDSRRGSQVAAAVKDATDAAAAKAFEACKRGAHGDFDADLPQLVKQAERLAHWLQGA
jgi:hypothetical protein